MYKSGFFSLLVLALLCLIPAGSGLVAQGSAVRLGAASSADGAVTTLVNPGPQSYLKFSTVDTDINRVRIMDDQKRVLFDGSPKTGQTVALPPGRYTATCWSGCRTASAAGINCSFVNGPAPVKTPPSAKSTPAAIDGQTPSGGYPANTNNNYNYGYPYRHTTPCPRVTNTPTPKPTSILDPNYHQKSILDPSYQKSQKSVTDPVYTKQPKPSPTPKSTKKA